MNDYKKRVIKNFTSIDNILSKLSTDSQIYWLLFSIRTEYSVIDELRIHNGKVTVLSETVNLFRFICLTILYSLIEITVENKSATLILGNHRFDKKLSSEIDIPNFVFKKKIKFPQFSKIRTQITFFCILFKVFQTTLNKRKLIRCLSLLLDFSKFYNEINLNNIKTLIFEDDLNPVHVAILLKAKLRNVARVKIEYVQIDFLQHNNVFADYYFYPSSLHRKVREKSVYNDGLVYIEGGYLNLEFSSILNMHAIKDINVVTYFTSHSDLFIHGDIYYINKILVRLPLNGILNIKVHPYDNYEKYSFLLKDNRVRLYMFGEIENRDLISESSVCISIFSAVSLEAKFTCNNSYFINYSFEESNFAEDCLEFEKYFDIISSDEMLDQVLSNTYSPVPLTLFKKNVNMAHPNTFEFFISFLNKLTNNQIDN